MADQKNKALARHLSQVKQLAPSVTLENYYQEIKPFLFGTTSTQPISAENLPEGGIYAVAKSGVMSPSDDKVIIKVAGRVAAEFKIANVRNQEFISDVQSKKRSASEYLFPSDLVRILTGLARLFRNGNSTATGLRFTYNQEKLEKFRSEPDDLRWVRQWGEVNVDAKLLRIDSGLFYEKKFETKYADKVSELLAEVVAAAVEYENIFKPIDTDQFVPRSELQSEYAIPDLKENILDSFPAYKEKVEPLINTEEKFAEASEKLSDKIIELIKSNQADIFRELWTRENEKEFSQLEIADLERNFYLWTTRSTDNKDGILQTEQYQEFRAEATRNFLEQHEQSLENEYIDPLFAKTQAQPAAGEADEDQDQGETQEEPKITIIENPISLDDFRTQLASDLITGTYRQFIFEYIEETLRQEQPDDYKSFIDNQYTFENQYLEPVYDDIRENVVQGWLNDFEFTQEAQEALREQGLYQDDQVSNNIFESDWYQSVISGYLNQLSDLKPPQGKAANYYEYLYTSLVAPPIQILSETTPEQAEQEEAPTITETEPRPAAGATVPREIPSIVTVQASELTTQTQEVSRLTPEQIRSLQYESAWMYNRAVYELFTAHGISEDEVRNLNPQLLQELQAGIFSYTAGLDQESLSKLFASSTQRQKSLLEFYKAFYQKNNTLLNSFYSELPSTSTWNTLTTEQKQALSTRTRDVFLSNRILSPEQILSSALTEATNLENPVLYQNIKNTVDTWVQQYGLNEPYYAFDPETKTITEFQGDNNHDVVWFIENLSAERIELILGLPEGMLVNNKEFERQFKEILLQYAKYSHSEQTLHIKNITLQDGLLLVSEADAKAIERGDEIIIRKHLSFTSGLRESNKEHGSETVAGALDNKKDSSRKEVLKHQYKTFLPLWNQLSGLEQAEIYKKYGLVVPKNLDLEIEKLEFQPELVGFDITDLNRIKEIVENRRLSKEEKDKLLELIAIQDQLQKEEALSEFFIDSQEYYSEVEEIEVITELAGVDSSYRERFYQEQVAYEEAGPDYGVTHPIVQNLPSRKNPGIRKKISNSRLGRALKKRFKKKLDPLKKAKKGFKNAVGGLATKGAAAALNAVPVVGTGLSAALMAIPNKKVRNAVAGVILTGVTALVSSTIYALGSIGGIIGAAIGAGVGFVVSGGAVAIPSAIVGAHVGNAILPTRWTGLIFGSTRAASAPVATATTANLASSVPTAQATLGLNSFMGISIGVLAPFGAVAAMIFSTMFIIFIIQSPFLIPVPQERQGGSVGELGPNGFDCFVFAEPNQLVDIDMEEQLQGISISWTQEEKERVYEAYARRAGKNSCFNSYVCSGGTISLYRLAGDEYGGWAPSALGGKALFLYDLAFSYSIDSLEYTLIHELGHIIDYTKVNDFLNKFTQIWDQPSNGCLTYPYPNLCSAAEAFAESITLYVNHETYLYDGALFDFPNQAPAEYEWVEQNIFCDEPIEESEESYLAIGPLQQSNIVMSTEQEIQNPQLTCTWAQGKGLDVAINANFFNTKQDNSLVPVGIAGFCPTGNSCSNAVQYYEDATIPSLNPYLKAFAYDTNGSVQIINTIPSLKAEAPNLSSAITGLYSNTQGAQLDNKRTIIGVGTANSECSQEYAGQSAMFMAVLPFASYQEAEDLLFECGATDIIHLDGGGSSNFCSFEGTFSQSRYIPVNMGMKDAEIIIQQGNPPEEN